MYDEADHARGNNGDNNNLLTHKALLDILSEHQSLITSCW